MAKEIDRDPIYRFFNKIDELSCEAFDDVFYCRNDAYIPRTIEALDGIIDAASHSKKYIQESTDSLKKHNYKYSQKSLLKMLGIAVDNEISGDIRLKSIKSAMYMIDGIYLQILERIELERFKEENEEDE